MKWLMRLLFLLLAGVVLLLDQQLRGQKRIVVHPLDNQATTVLSAEGLEAVLRWVGGVGRWLNGQVAIEDTLLKTFHLSFFSLST